MSYTFERRGQKMKFKTNSDGSLGRDYMLRYFATSNSATDLSVVDVLAGLGLQAGSTLQQDANAILGEIEVDRLPTIPPCMAWDVALNYSTKANSPQNTSSDPTQWRTKRSQRYRELTRNIIKHQDGTLIVNAAGEPLPGGVPVADYPYTFVYEWNRNVPTKKEFHKSVNQNRFNGCDPGTLLCLISREEVHEGSFHYWKETIEMHYDENGWQPSPVNAGLNQRKAGLTKLIPIRDAEGQPVSQAEPLYDAESESDNPAHVEGTVVPIDDRPDGCKFIPIDWYRETDFKKIGVNEFP